MPHAKQMSETNLSQVSVDTEVLVECIEACFDYAQACTACADACMGEQDVQMLTPCIRLDLDCGDVCEATGRLLLRQTAFEPEMTCAALEPCSRACQLCGEECEQHAQHGMEHCQVCAEVCRRCESSCNHLLSAIGA